MKKLLLSLLLLLCVSNANAQSDTKTELKKTATTIASGILGLLTKPREYYNVDLTKGKVKGASGLSVKLTRCLAQESTVFIDMVLTNNSDKDFERLSVGGNGSYANADAGSTCKDGNFLVALGNGSYTSGSSSGAFPAEVSQKIHLKLENVSTSATLIKLLDLKTYCKELGIEDKPLRFKNIPIERE